MAEAFQLTASAPAAQLALLCSALPEVSVRVLDVIRADLVPEATAADVAEVLVSGLLTLARDDAERVLRFRPGAQTALKAGLSAREAWQVYILLSQHARLAIQPGVADTTTNAAIAGAASRDSGDEASNQSEVARDFASASRRVLELLRWSGSDPSERGDAIRRDPTLAIPMKDAIEPRIGSTAAANPPDESFIRNRGNLVGVHGIANLAPDQTPVAAGHLLSAQWTAAVRRSLGEQSDLKVKVAYYAHLLAADPAGGTEDSANLSDQEQELLQRWLAELGAPAELGAQGQLSHPVQAATDWISRRFGLDPAVTRFLVARFCREVNAYFSNSDLRAGVRALVADTIAVRQARVVIAHSLGSVIAYEVLWAYPDLEVDLFITLGSPLALPGVVFDRLEPTPINRKGARPPSVHRWVNIADPGDIIALPPRLAAYFDGVDADLTTTAGAFAVAQSIGYLASPATATALATSPWH